jgi:hypothetical protein
MIPVLQQWSARAIPQMAFNVGRWNTEDRSAEGETIINSLFTAPKGPAYDTRQNPLLMARLIVATYLCAGVRQWDPNHGPGIVILGYVPIDILDRCIREVTGPRSASRNCWDESLIRQSTRAASFTGSVSPAISLLVKLVQSALHRRLMFDLGLCLMQPADRDRCRGGTAEPELLGSTPLNTGGSSQQWRRHSIMRPSQRCERSKL